MSQLRGLNNSFLTGQHSKKHEHGPQCALVQHLSKYSISPSRTVQMSVIGTETNTSAQYASQEAARTQKHPEHLQPGARRRDLLTCALTESKREWGVTQRSATAGSSHAWAPGAEGPRQAPGAAQQLCPTQLGCLDAQPLPAETPRAERGRGDPHLPLPWECAVQSR